MPPARPQIFVLLYFVYFAVAIYLDNVLSNENGVSRHWWYLFTPSYWFPRARDSREALAHASELVRSRPPFSWGRTVPAALVKIRSMRSLLNGSSARAGLEHARSLTWRPATVQSQQLVCFARRKRPGA